MKRTYWKRWLVAAAIITLFYTVTLCAGTIATANAFAQLTIKAPQESLAGDLVVLSIGDGVSSPTSAGAATKSHDVPLWRGIKGEDESEKTATLLPSTPLPPAGGGQDVTSFQCSIYAWSVTPPELVEGKFWVGDNGRTVTFASRLSGTYYFTVASNVGGKLEIFTHRLENIAPETTPKPLPVPPIVTPLPPIDPPPKVDPEPVKLDIEASISALKTLADVKSKELIKSQYFDRERKALAESFLATAKQIEDGTITATAEARTKQRDNSRKFLSSVTRTSWQTWEPWDKVIAKQLADIDATQTLTVEQLGKAYKQIGIGLQ